MHFSATFTPDWQSRKLFAVGGKSGFHPRVSKLEKLLIYWLPPLAWMLLIFFASADTHSAQHSSRFFLPFLHWLFPDISEERADFFHHIFRKCGHLTEYAILAFLFWRAIRQPGKGERPPWRWDQAGLAVGLVFLYAALDEFHQIFVPTRTAMVSDVFIDTFGGLIGLLLLWFVGKIFKRW